MCNETVGVVKRIDLERVSKELAQFVKELDKEVQVKLKVPKIRKFQSRLEKILA